MDKVREAKKEPTVWGRKRRGSEIFKPEEKAGETKEGEHGCSVTKKRKNSSALPLEHLRKREVFYKILEEAFCTNEPERTNFGSPATPVDDFKGGTEGKKKRKILVSSPIRQRKEKKKGPGTSES